MASLGSNGPVWWDREVDSAGRPIRPDVRAAAHEIWGSAYRRVQALLGDASEAPELMEKVVVQVSRYLDRTGAGLFTQNTSGILMCAFCRSLRRYATKLNRLQLVGGTSELSERRITPNWSALVELWLDLEKLSRNVSHKTRAMVGLRMGGFDWKEIAGVLHMTDTAARTAFWREVRRARLKSLGKSPQDKRQ
jgi:DNA-directed RNA polymerase specialized sigma24 family protein